MVRPPTSNDAMIAPPPGRPGGKPPEATDIPATAAAFAHFLPLIQLPPVTPAPPAQHSPARATPRSQQPTDVAARAALELKSRGEVRLTVQSAASRAVAAGERAPHAHQPAVVNEALDKASGLLAHDPATSQPRFHWSSNAPTDTTPRESAAYRQAPGAAPSEPPAPAQQPARPHAEAAGNAAPQAGVPIRAAQLPVSNPTASAAATAPASANVAGPGPSNAAVPPSSAPHGGVTGSSRPDAPAPRVAPGSQNPAARPLPQSPESSSGVRGQAMRGVFAMLRGTPSGTSTALLTLAPDALGQMRINLSMENGRIAATFSVTTDEAHASLADSVPELREALESRGLIVDEVRVIRAPRDAGGEHNAANQDHDGRNGLAGDSRSGSQGERESADREGRRDAAGRAADQEPGAEAPAGGTHDATSATSRRLGVDLTA
ncbi:MAG: hypothetical protein GIKADHBN_02813 [Phycisphaerales bacterium]|nr:hypothetical protein [Phycisphaerales bacterium]